MVKLPIEASNSKENIVGLCVTTFQKASESVSVNQKCQKIAWTIDAMPGMITVCSRASQAQFSEIFFDRRESNSFLICLQPASPTSCHTDTCDRRNLADRVTPEPWMMLVVTLFFQSLIPDSLPWFL